MSNLLQTRVCPHLELSFVTLKVSQPHSSHHQQQHKNCYHRAQDSTHKYNVMLSGVAIASIKTRTRARARGRGRAKARASARARASTRARARARASAKVRARTRTRTRARTSLKRATTTGS